MPNGLLPPLRPPGRPPGAAGPPGRGGAGVPGRGGTAPGVGRGALGRVAGVSVGVGRPESPPRPLSVAGCRRCLAALTAASCSAFSAAARASAAATSMSCALAGLIAGPPADGGGVGTGLAVRFCGIAGRAGTAFATAGVSIRGAAAWAAAGALCCAGRATKTSRSRRATGASMVLDADLTNSPISLSLASTTLLSTPSSFASSCTRALPATALLTPRPHGQGPDATSLVHLKPGHFWDFIVCSCWSSLPCCPGGTTGPTNGGPESLDVLDQRTGVGSSGHPQRAPEGAAAFRQCETGQIRMQMRAPTRPLTGRIGLKNDCVDPAPYPDQPQQLGGRRTLPAAHTGADRRRASCHPLSLPCTPPEDRAPGA
jgi:hypothetical protein